MQDPLVQIQPASVNLRQQVYGKLPAALTDPNRKLYRKAWSAVDAIADGLRASDRSIVERVHNVIRSTSLTIKRELCRDYRYPDPDPTFPDHWEVICTSGTLGEFYKSEGACLNCLFFNTDNNPRYEERA